MRNEKKSDRDGMPRRQFLVVGSVAVAAAAAASSVSAGAIRAMSGPIGGSVLSIGFMESGSAAGGLTQASHPSLSDRELVTGGARLTIHGFWRPEARRNAPLSVNVSTFVDVAGVPLPVLAWGYHTSAKVTFAAGRLSLRLPADRTNAVTIGIERSVPARSPRSGRLASLLGRRNAPDLPVLETLDRNGSICRLGGEVALQPGTYFIAVGDNAREKAPDWNRVSVEPLAGRLEPHGASVLRHGANPVPFEYLMVSIDRLDA